MLGHAMKEMMNEWKNVECYKPHMNFFNTVVDHHNSFCSNLQ